MSPLASSISTSIPPPQVAPCSGGRVPARHPQQPLMEAAASQPFPRLGAVTRSLAPREESEWLPRVTAAPAAAGRGCPSPVPRKHRHKPGAGLGDLPQLRGARLPAPHPRPRCSNVALPFSQPRKSNGSPASCPPPKLIPTCAIALINNSAVANYSLSSSLSSSLIPGKQRHVCIDRIVCFSPSFLSFCCSVSLFEWLHLWPFQIGETVEFSCLNQAGGF